MKISTRFARVPHPQHGVTLIEVLISMVILAVGSLGLLGVFGLALSSNQTSQEDQIARQLASEAMESVYTARNTSQLSWTQIQNISNGGIFTDGVTNIMCAGPDGLEGTADDTSCYTAMGAVCPNGGIRCLSEPGADGIVGTADDQIVSLSNFTRQIQIAALSDSGGNLIPTLREVTITIQYSVPSYSAKKTYILNEYVSEYH